jgi:peptidyl-tRNA hydrolase, PTH1 family
MKIIIGLGNTGNKYKNTRHNIGFSLIDLLSKKLDSESFKKFKDCSEISKTKYLDEDIILVKPTTFMNNSGLCVRKILDFYKEKIENILILVDDYNLDVGNIRFRKNGSSGGHNGLKSIIECLGTEEFQRLRLGIGKPEHKTLSDFVLSSFTPSETKNINGMLTSALDACLVWVEFGADKVMNMYNKKQL